MLVQTLVVSVSLQLACFHWKNEIQLQACNHLLDYHIFRVEVDGEG